MLSSLYSLRTRRDADGFTLIELLVVVIIIGLLAAIALPIFIDQTKTSVDASVKADVRNTVTNVTNAQAQKVGSVKAAVSDANTNVALKVEAAGGTTVVATKVSTTLDNVPDLGTAYSVHGWNPSGKTYQGTAANPAWTFTSVTGKFTQGTGDAPTASAAADSGSGSGSTGGSSAVAPQWTTAAALAGATQNSNYNTTLAASGTPAPAFELATGSTLPTGLSLNATSGVLSGIPTAAGSSTFTVLAKSSAGSDSRTFSLVVTAPNPPGTYTFDADAEGFLPRASGDSATQTTTTPRRGAGALSVYSVLDGPDNGAMGPVLNVPANAGYNLTGYARAVSKSGGAYLCLRYYRAGGYTVSCAAGTTTTSGYTRLSGSASIPSGASEIRAFLYSGTTYTTILWDDITVTQQ